MSENIRDEEVEVEVEVGVIVGRFQSPYLHDGYKCLFDYVRSKHSRVFVFI